jgi:glutamate synthase domain-containing protein 1/glutamate synthase domain-containing protein 3
MPRAEWPDRVLVSRRRLPSPESAVAERAAEGGCGVIGLAVSVPVAGRHLLQALTQMRNRGNGKGGGIAAVGLDPAFFGTTLEVVENDYLLAVALLDPAAAATVEREFVEPVFEVDHVLTLAAPPPQASLGLEVPPPTVRCWFVRVRPDVRERFLREERIAPADAHRVDDEIVYQNTYRLNGALYASLGEKRAFVLSHAKNLLVLKLVGYGDDVVRAYRLEDLHAHVWIGHHRYPTKGRVWHPGGAHPFLGMHEALVHNGDFANYASIASYLAERGIEPLFLTDTEVAVQVFDLLHRVYGYSLEYVIEALAPTTERDFTLLPAEKQRVYRALQTLHIHASPDGPWFFLIAQSEAARRAYRLIGITDTSMLRPQVFALQRGEVAVGLAASERQAIDAALESLAAADPRFWPRADRYWNARGGSHTDGGAFLFEAVADGWGRGTLVCRDKFGREVEVARDQRPLPVGWPMFPGKDPEVRASAPRPEHAIALEGPAEEIFAEAARRLPSWDYEELAAFLADVEGLTADEGGRETAFRVTSLLLDRRVPTGGLKRSCIVTLVESSLTRMFEAVRRSPGSRWAFLEAGGAVPDALAPERTLIVDARGFPQEGPESVARALVALVERGWRRFVVAHCRGHRFIGSGLGVDSAGVVIDVYGAAGDYLASGIDGAEIEVHGAGQDQLAQIMKHGRLVVHGDVGQTFGYGAKGGTVFVLGNAAGRPLINAVGRPRVVINGTCLDYLGESFMAGDPLHGGGFAILNGVAFDEHGALLDLPMPYPGGNLFSLASGGALYVRDPHRCLTEDQLNGGDFATLGAEDWELMRPLLEENARLFGIPLSRLLTVAGEERWPQAVYRKIAPSGHKALAPEEAWVRPEH